MENKSSGPVQTESSKTDRLFVLNAEHLLQQGKRNVRPAEKPTD